MQPAELQILPFQLELLPCRTNMFLDCTICDEVTSLASTNSDSTYLIPHEAGILPLQSFAERSPPRSHLEEPSSLRSLWFASDAGQVQRSQLSGYIFYLLKWDCVKAQSEYIGLPVAGKVLPSHVSLGSYLTIYLPSHWPKLLTEKLRRSTIRKLPIPPRYSEKATPETHIVRS